MDKLETELVDALVIVVVVVVAIGAAYLLGVPQWASAHALKLGSK